MHTKHFEQCLALRNSLSDFQIYISSYSIDYSKIKTNLQFFTRHNSIKYPAFSHTQLLECRCQPFPPIQLSIPKFSISVNGIIINQISELSLKQLLHFMSFLIQVLSILPNYLYHQLPLFNAHCYYASSDFFFSLVHYNTTIPSSHVFFLYFHPPDSQFSIVIIIKVIFRTVVS